MADDRVDAICHQRMSRLDRDQPAEPRAEHEYRPDAKGAAGREKHNAQPAHGLAIERPEPDAVRVGRQVRIDETDQAERRDDPAVGAILALARAQIACTEQCQRP